MMPCESWNAREAALLRMERASARTMAEEMAARCVCAVSRAVCVCVCE